MKIFFQTIALSLFSTSIIMAVYTSSQAGATELKKQRAPAIKFHCDKDKNPTCRSISLIKA